MSIFKKNSSAKSTGNALKDKSEERETKSSKNKSNKPFFAFFQNESFKKVLGGFLILSGLFTLLAFISFLFTWKADQSFNQGFTFQNFFTIDPDAAENWMRLLGARVSFLLMYNGFGLAAFPIPIVIIAAGFKLYTESKKINLFEITKFSLLFVVWASLFLGLIFSSYNTVYAGVFGVRFYFWLKGLIGMLGVIMVLILYFFTFTTLQYGYYPFRDYMANRKNAEPVLDNEEDFRTKEDSIFEKDNIDIQPKEEVKTDLEDEENEECLEGIELSTATPPAVAKVNPTDDLELEIEAPEEEVLETENKTPAYGSIDSLYDPTLDLPGYQFPKLEFLNEYSEKKTEVSKVELEKSKNLIVETLKNYKIDISQIKATIGPTVTLFEIVPAPGVKISKIKNLEDDIALSLAALGIRIVAPIPGKGTIGIEVPNISPEIVSMRSVLASPKFQDSTYDLPVCLGKTISNEVFVADLAKMPHLLMAGATGQGKSVGLNAMLVSLMYKKHPAELKFVLVDPKKVELTLFNAIERHFLAKMPGDDNDAIITDNKKVVNTLNSLCIEMDNRYDLLQTALVRNLKEYNAKFVKRKLNPNDGHRFLPFIVVVIDEVADLIMTAGKEVEHPIGRLAQLARAVGIHLVLATQRPSVNIITGTIKANFPARIAFRVTSKIDSRTILDANGADQLIGKGDMLYSSGSDLIRLQCPFVDTPEVEAITAFIGNQRGYPAAYSLPEVEEEGGSGTVNFDPSDRDALFEDAARIVVQHQQGSTSLIQRKLKVGYNRAGRLIDQLEQANIVGQFEGSKARAVLYPDEYSLEQYLNTL
jgi:S-DNA-T family DNA segregation ATPase FtsK/SpoIIIE